MAQFTARFRVASRTPLGGNNSQTDIVLRGKQASDGSVTENAPLFRDDQGPLQQIQLRIDRAQEKPVFTVGSDVLVTFNGPA